MCVCVRERERERERGKSDFANERKFTNVWEKGWMGERKREREAMLGDTHRERERERERERKK